jgi:endonuclease/exonuclease/phosphatase (EEP) superfamily protein YafD
MKAFRKLIICGTALLSTSCMMLAETRVAPELLANHPVTATSGPAECGTAILAADTTRATALLDPESIDLFVWNIHKGAHTDALNDLAALAGQMDLVLLQEANLDTSHHDRLQHASYWSFAPGYRSARSQTGVVTLSSVQPLVHCIFSDQEPWLNTPKAISITEFGLSGSDQTLAVVNIHGINFTLGAADLGRQLEKIQVAIENHDGPVIVAGDFNTWSEKRVKRVEQFCAELGMTDLEFSIDERVSAFGHPLDRVLVRGLRVIDAKTNVVDSSDHNPLTLRLSI